MSEITDLFRDHLTDWQSGWSMGAFGAIAEFHQDADEGVVIDETVRLRRATRRGAIAIDRGALVGTRLVAYETLSPKRHRWSHALAICAPEALAKRSARTVLTEIGPDDDAVRGIDRTGILFDMGLGLPQCDFCIRTSDPRLLNVLRENLGRSVFDPTNTAMAAILTQHPHRVALSNIGRIEVYQKIGGPDTGGVSPPGPHTHVLPKLLKTGRTHSANTPIPPGLVPLAWLHPGNPVIGPLGEDRPFDERLYEAFQALMAKFGTGDAVTVKLAVIQAIRLGSPPRSFPEPADRNGRAALRIALRQLEHVLGVRPDDAARDALRRWIETHDGVGDMADDDAPGH